MENENFTYQLSLLSAQTLIISEKYNSLCVLVNCHICVAAKMGITGLLPQLKSIVDYVDLQSYKGMTVGVDASVWLHRGVYGCATPLALGQKTEGYVRFCESMLCLLLSAGVIPYLVFDGGYLPMKKGTEEQRRADREKAMAAGLEAHRKGDLATAHTFFTRAVDVTPAMAAAFMRVLRLRNITFVVAPYEADAQLAFLAKQNVIQVRSGEWDGLAAVNSKLAHPIALCTSPLPQHI